MILEFCDDTENKDGFFNTLEKEAFFQIIFHTIFTFILSDTIVGYPKYKEGRFYYLLYVFMYVLFA